MRMIREFSFLSELKWKINMQWEYGAHTWGGKTIQFYLEAQSEQKYAVQMFIIKKMTFW